MSDEQAYAEKASVQFLLQPKPVLFVAECTLSRAEPYSSVKALVPKAVALCLFSAYKTLNPIAFSQQGAFFEPQREDAAGSRLNFLYSSFGSLSHLSAQSTRDSLLLSCWEANPSLGQVWPMPTYSWPHLF